jgi:murein DD-endopeptidase MepM/ murein hydrolase activator NlpD
VIVRITSKFGAIDGVHHTPHTGVDIGIPSGTTLRSVGDGIVDKVFDGSGAIGKGLSVKFADGSRAIYGHMSDVKAKVGEHIIDGQVVGFSGNTGHTTGAHLHLGLRGPDGHFADPTALADKAVNGGFWDRVFVNGRVGDGIGDLHVTTLKEWAGGKLAEISFDGVADYIADIALAFPVIAVVSGAVYVLIRMFSKGAAKWGAIGTIIYGMLAAR